MDDTIKKKKKKVAAAGPGETLDEEALSPAVVDLLVQKIQERQFNRALVDAFMQRKAKDAVWRW